MTRYVWPRIIVATLIFLGDWAFAAESRLRVEIEAAASDIATQISKQTILDDHDASAEPAIPAVGTTAPVVFTIDHTLASVAYTVPDELKYLPIQPRAPPQTATR
jgi:hypothetical protein